METIIFMLPESSSFSIFCLSYMYTFEAFFVSILHYKAFQKFAGH